MEEIIITFDPPAQREGIYLMPPEYVAEDLDILEDRCLGMGYNVDP